MTTFVDSSAIYAVLDADDQFHPPAADAWQGLLAQGEQLLSTNYVLVEAFALVQRRLGMRAVQVLQDDLLPVIGVEWIDERGHYSGVMALLTANRRGLSLVDCISFETMRRLGIDSAFAFDADFEEQGFSLTPNQ